MQWGFYLKNIFSKFFIFFLPSSKVPNETQSNIDNNEIALEEIRQKNLPTNADTFTRILEETSILTNGTIDSLTAGFNFSQIPNHQCSSLEASLLSSEEQEEASITALILSILGAIAWFYYQHTGTNLSLLQAQKRLNPWYRRFKTAYGFGNSIGQSIANVLPLEHIFSPTITKILQNLLGGAIGVIVGISAGLFMPTNPTDDKNIFKFGVDGWTKYSKVGLVMGTGMGAAIGAALGSFVFPGLGTIAGAAIGGAIGGVVSFLGFSISVPCLNKIKNLISSSQENDKPTYRTNYIRAGMSLGNFLGAFIGGIVGFFIPIPMATFACAAIGAGIGTLLGGIILGIAGPTITAKLDPAQKSPSSWDYGFRTGSEIMGSKYGVGIFATGIFSLFNIGKDKDVKDIACGGFGLLIGLITLAYDAFTSSNNKDKSPEEIAAKKPLLPWSQRVASFAVVGSFLGAAIGFAFPPFGALIGAGIGGIVFGIAAATAGDKIFDAFSRLSLKIQSKLKDTCKENKETPLDRPHPLPTQTPPRSRANSFSKINGSLTYTNTLYTTQSTTQKSDKPSLPIKKDKVFSSTFFSKKNASTSISSPSVISPDLPFKLLPKFYSA